MTADGGGGNDARTLRGRQLALRADLDAAQAGGGELSTRRQLVQVIDGGSMPTMPNYFFLGNPVDVGGSESEGSAIAAMVNTSLQVPFVCLYHAPSVGDQIPIAAVGGRWVGQRGPGPTKICVTACSLPLYGATIQLWTTGTGSTLVASCTTTSGGCCSFTQSGSYVVKVVISGTTYTEGTRTLNGTTITIAVSAGSSIVCCGGYAIPTSLTLTDAAGSLSFVYYPNYYYPIWYGGHAVNRTSCSVTTPGGVCVAAAPSNGPVKVCYQMICFAGSTPTFSVQRSWSWVYQPGTLTPIWYQDPSGITPGQPCTTAPPASCGSPHTDTASFSANPTTTSPFALSGTPAAASGNYTSDPVGGSVAISA